MQDGQLPVPVDGRQVQLRREHLDERLVTPYQGLSDVDDLLEDLIQRQRSRFGTTSSKNVPMSDDEDDKDAPPDPARSDAPPNDSIPNARFAPSDFMRRPSDYVAMLVKRFEGEWINPRTGQKKPRQARLLM